MTRYSSVNVNNVDSVVDLEELDQRQLKKYTDKVD